MLVFLGARPQLPFSHTPPKVKVKVAKNKLSPPFGKAEVIDYGSSPWTVMRFFGQGLTHPLF